MRHKYEGTVKHVLPDNVKIKKIVSENHYTIWL